MLPPLNSRKRCATSSLTVSLKTFEPEPTASGTSAIRWRKATSAICSALPESTSGKCLGTLTVKVLFMRGVPSFFTSVEEKQRNRDVR
jgi:hypothetical protein